MAQEIVGIKIETDTRSLRSQFKEAMAELAKLQNQAGASAKEIANAAKRAAELKDRIGDAKALTDAFNPDAKFKALTSSLSGVAGGIGAVQGAMALFGKEKRIFNS
jgi:chromosome segregation ATPase